MTLVAKPGTGFITPYQILLNDLNNFFSDNIVKEYTPDYAFYQPDLIFNETNCDIKVPVKTETGTWETEIISISNNIYTPIKINFNTIDIFEFIKDSLEIDKYTFKIGKITEIRYGFYIAGNSNYAALKIPKDFKFNDSIKFNGIEIPLDMYKVTPSSNKIIIDSPIAQGELYFSKEI